MLIEPANQLKIFLNHSSLTSEKENKLTWIVVCKVWHLTFTQCANQFKTNTNQLNSMKQNLQQLLVFMLTLLFSPAFSQTTLRIEDASSFGSGFCSFNGSRQNSYSGASNGYYINLSNSSGMGIDWKVNAPAAGAYTLVWRYANAGSSSATTARVLVNGVSVASSVSFPKTTSWTTWVTNTGISVNLASGVNTVRLETTVSSEFANIDWIEVTGNNPTAASCSGTVTNYTLTANSSPSAGGSVSPSSGSYAAGSTVAVTATPASGYVFTGWSGSASGTTNPLTLTMDGNKSVTANFSQQQSYTLTTSVSGSGTITKSPDAASYVSGTAVTLTATPAGGYTFDGWSGAVTGTTNPVSITMDANKTVTATFSQTTTPPPTSSELIGYATLNGGTTGGQGGSSTTVSTLAELESWALSREQNSTPEILYINGKISSSSGTVVTIKYGGNISVIGLGGTAELQNVGLNFREYNNIIVKNIKIHEVLYPNDGLTIDNCQNVWVDHCELYSKIGAGITVDTYDGLLDIKKGSRYVTISWCHLHHHMKTMLIGHTDNSSQQAIDSQFRITLHHNYFENTSGRNPSLRWGAVHMFNNYFKDIDDYGTAVRQGAHALIQNNVYENVNIPIATDKFDGIEGYACENGNIFSGTSGANSITQTGCDWWNSTTLPYSYTPDAASSVAANVSANAGVEVTSGSTSNIRVENQSLALSNTTADGFYVKNYPNPMSDVTVFEFNIIKSGNVKISLYDISGKKVDDIINRQFSAGMHQIHYRNLNLNNGFYVYKFSSQEGDVTGKLMVKK